MRPSLMLIPLLALAACDRAETPPKTTAVAEAPAGEAPAPQAEPAFQPPSFAGRWAAGPQLCADGAWVFRTDGVATAGEVSCSFKKVEPSASGYRIEAACTHEGSQSDGEIVLSMTDPAPPQSMTVEGGPWDGPITLQRCPA